MAMNSAKENGKNSYCLFESHMNTKLLEKYELEEDLRQALINQDLFYTISLKLIYQLAK